LTLIVLSYFTKIWKKHQTTSKCLNQIKYTFDQIFTSLSSCICACFICYSQKVGEGGRESERVKMKSTRQTPSTFPPSPLSLSHTHTHTHTRTYTHTHTRTHPHFFFLASLDLINVNLVSCEFLSRLEG